MSLEDQIAKQNQSYGISYSIENKIRVAMHNLLINLKGPNYFNNEVFPEFVYDYIRPDKELNIVMHAKRTKSAENKKFPGESFDYPFLWYLDLNVLIAVLDNFWNEYFFRLFMKPNKIRDEIIFRLKKVSYIRNSIAHNRFLNDFQIAELKSLNIVLENSIDPIFLFNYKELAFKSLDETKSIILSIIKRIKDKISRLDMIERKVIRSFNSHISIYFSISKSKISESDIDKINTVFENYN